MAEKILVVDDEPDTVSLLGLTLARAGYSVVKATSGKSCLDLAQKEKPDVIILDVMLPDMTGLDVLRALRSSADLTPVIFFTARGRVEDMAEGLAAGAYKYLVKPTSRERLLETIKAALADAQK